MGYGTGDMEHELSLDVRCEMHEKRGPCWCTCEICGLRTLGCDEKGKVKYCLKCGNFYCDKHLKNHKCLYTREYKEYLHDKAIRKAKKC